MSKWSAESTGMAVLRPIAASQLQKDPSIKKRIWSDEFEAWGFFASEKCMTPRDMFLLWCSIVPGDRLVVGIEEENPQVSTVVGIWRESDSGTAIWIFRLIDQFGKLIKINIDENELFRQAFNLTF